MKILIVYYSRTGLTKKIGNKIASGLDVTVEEITDQTVRSGVVGYFRCGKEAIQKILPVINPPKNNPANYDLVVVGTPVWAATMASPIRTYLMNQKDKFKHVAFFVTQGGEGANLTINKMTDLCELKPLASLTILSREVVKDDCENKIQKFIKDLNA